MSNFLRNALEEGKNIYETIVTRFPPEPNGFLHLGHAKSIWVNFTVAEEFGGRCHLRFDDTNPLVEKNEYVESIKNDIRWLGFDWGEHLYHASDYFPQLYDWAKRLILEGKAYVDSQNELLISLNRGTVKTPGVESPFRDRPVDESLRLLGEMRDGLHSEGSHVVRAKGDMADPNMKMRDPLMYRIIRRPHDRTGDRWNIYPMYDYAHGLSDAIEGISHSICTLEFDNNRALYDLFLDLVGFEEPRPHQYEMARLNLTHTTLSKRKLKILVDNNIVEGWYDPRMPTLAGLRNRGVPPEAILDFISKLGVSKSESQVSIELLEDSVRKVLEPVSPKYSGVLDPLPVRIGSTFVFIERSDFSLNPPKGWKRLTPDQPVRLRNYGVIRVTEVISTDTENILNLVAEIIEHPSPKKLGTIHWVAESTAVDIACTVYNHLFNVESPDKEEDILAHVNTNSKSTVVAKIEPQLLSEAIGTRIQLIRNGFFYLAESEYGLELRRVVSLKSSYNPNKTQEIK